MKGNLQEIIDKLIYNPDMPLKEVYAYCETVDDLQLIIDEYQKAEERKFKETEGIFRFINSFALADYLKEIAYPFTPIESAYLIYHSKRTDIKERHEAWQKIIDTMPDEMIETPAMGEWRLHTLIKEYMGYQNIILFKFGLSKENVYFYSAYVDADKWDDEFEKAIRDLCKERVFADDYKRIIELKKRGSDNNMLFLLDKNGNVINIMPCERIEAGRVFDGLCLIFPTPNL